ncbi:sigma-70 family RNA polymerase sigma factor [Streptomyces sp. NPDC005345]|uniref:sigma-70 family RNA polymerase sigma factor n=1 Tax=Streptomyces sp. NPDC005345 TaxID=3156877 RepID=UPI0033BE5CC7
MTMRQHSRTTYERSRSGIRRPADAPDTDAVFGRIAALRNGPERTALRQVVVCAWTPMAERLARRFRHRGETSEDLSRVARLGLVKAVAGFDPGAGSAFPSFAVPTILAEVKRHFRDDLWAGRMPRRVQEVRGPVRAAGHELDAEPGGRGPTVPEIAAHTGPSESDVRLGQAASQSFASVSLEAAPGRSAGSRRPAHTLGELEPGIDRAADRAALRPLLRALPERERQILCMRFFGEMTQDRIGLQLGISQRYVSRLIGRTCAILRRQGMADARDPREPA